MGGGLSPDNKLFLFCSEAGASLLRSEPAEAKVIGYVTVGTNDLAKGAVFYDAIAQELGVGRMMQGETYIAWGKPGGPAGVGLTRPFNGEPATVGNGVMVAFEASDPAQVDRIHALALSLGGADEGAPGDRGGGFYAGYFRDLDGNKLNAYCMRG
jgi:catechol 2,3-dioxygenase-like lactoylglutathione lyase family enzyme